MERTETGAGAGSSPPLVSVIVVVRNGADTIERCLLSIARQSYRRTEVVVVDGASTDGTVDIIRRHARDIAWWTSEPDAGIYQAWNKGLNHASGEWICFLGADDYLWGPDVLERAARVLESAYPPYRVVYGEVAVVNRRGEAVVTFGEEWPAARRKLEQIMSIPHTGLMHHRSLFQRHGPFDESYRIAGDYEMLLRELLENNALFVPGLLVAAMQHGGVSATPAGRRLSLLEYRRAQRAHGIRRPGGLWLSSYAKAQLRVWLARLLGERVAAYAFDLGRLLGGKGPYWTRQ